MSASRNSIKSGFYTDIKIQSMSEFLRGLCGKINLVLSQKRHSSWDKTPDLRMNEVLLPKLADLQMLRPVPLLNAWLCRTRLQTPA